MFTEFMEMVEARFSPDAVDAMLDRAAIGHDGAYTAVGHYPHEEMVRLVGALSEQTRLPVPQLLEAFGEYLFGRLAVLHPNLLAERPSLFDLLGRLDDTIHPEVLRLYPDAQLPRFSVVSRDAGSLALRYDSPRRMEELAKGLIHGAAKLYGLEVGVRLEAVAGDDPHVIIHVESTR
ncbi:heme NO-binding domain-containing protein [Lysobacter sp. CAU 1642]|uniref:Heme NO-binding domain-containing protein n=1 Tax=Pseudomarimonas salicorniae TaxID=2933270 RepID=A0ABT0GHV4_9GAMM|nr:heme NO-binding domain-containing protein [Lysobacter sp. CAU 1642]